MTSTINRQPNGGRSPEKDGSDRAVVLVKAAPQVGARHGETVCCAGISVNTREWLRLYPINFRQLEKKQQFNRWDIIEFHWRRPRDDTRIESRRITNETIEVVGSLKKTERLRFLTPHEVTGLDECDRQGKSLALLRPCDPKFIVEKKTQTDIEEEKAVSEEYFRQMSLFQSDATTPIEPCPFRFKYQYQSDDGQRTGTCQDWETDATYFNWTRQFGEEAALAQIQSIFGDNYPEAGMVFAMGTHSRYPTWLINGVIRLDRIEQGALL